MKIKFMTADEADDWAALEDAEIGQRVRRGIEHARGRDAPLPAAQDRAFTVSAECALRAATEQRIEADHAREHSVVAQAIPGYGRLP